MLLTDKQTGELTGYPSIDKPWEKYYKQENLLATLPACNYVDYIFEVNKHRLNEHALDYLGKKITYHRLFHQIDLVAKGLTSIGVNQGDIVTIFSVNTPETIFAVLALNKIGAIPCMEYVTESEKEAVNAIKQCKSRVVLVLDVLLPRFRVVGDLDSVEHVIVLPLDRSMPIVKKAVVKPKIKKVRCAKRITYSQLIRSGKEVSIKETPYYKDSPAVIVHSGGTTGAPKSVVLSNDNINYVGWAFSISGSDCRPGDLFYTCIPMFHAFGFVAGAIMPLIICQTLALAVKYDEKSFVKDFKRLKPNHTMSSSTYLPTLISDPDIQTMDLSFYKTMGMGGTPITHSIEKSLCDFMSSHHSVARASLGYGMSELASAACTELNRYYGKVGSVGIPLCKVNVKAVDMDTGEEQPYKKEGELYISSPGLMLNYLDNEKETRDAIIVDEKGERWIKTGDIGYIDEDGFVYITGRLKRIYTARTNPNGAIFHIFPDYIADSISSVPMVRDCVVVCLPHDVLKSVPVAFVVTDCTQTEKVKEEIDNYCANTLPEHSRPKAIYLIDSIPKTTVGKPDYSLLEKLAQENDSRKN